MFCAIFLAIVGIVIIAVIMGDFKIEIMSLLKKFPTDPAIKKMMKEMAVEAINEIQELTPNDTIQGNVVDMVLEKVEDEIKKDL